MPEAILRLEDVVRDFKRQTETIHAVHGVSLEIRRGTFNILCGRSGSGKTTLLNMLAAIDLPTSGKIFFEDQEITHMKSAERDALRRKKIGIIFQNTALIAQMTALENVEFALSVAGIKPGKRRRQAVDWLEQMGIRERKNHMPAGDVRRRAGARCYRAGACTRAGFAAGRRADLGAGYENLISRHRHVP